MRRFLITSPKFNGQAEIIYNARETLCCIDMTNTDMDEMTVTHFKQSVPVTISSMATAFSAITTIVEAGFEVSFEKFYKEYPMKRNRYKAEKVWQKLNDTEKVEAFYSLLSYKKYINRNTWYTPMIADKYLRDREFETDWNKVGK